MTIYIDPRCPPELDKLIRADAAKRGEQVMPRRPFPWNRQATREKAALPKARQGVSYLPGQLDLPECGHEPSKLLLQRQADLLLQPKTPQKPMDIGLFGDFHQQQELFK